MPFLNRVYTAAKTLCRGIVMLRIVPVILRNIKAGTMTETLALLDSGATVSLMDKSIMEELDLVGQSTAMNLQWLDGSTHSQSIVKQVPVEVKGQHSKAKWYKMNECYAVDRLQLPEVKLNREELIQSFPYLEKVEFKSIRGHPKLLIGENNATLIATHQLVHDVKNTPVASLTSLGWVISAYDKRGFRPIRIEEGNSLFPLNPVMDSNGLLRADGRLNYMSHVSAEFKNPIILHAENRIVQLMMTATHERLGHWGADYTLSELRTRFYIIKGKVILKGIQSGCKPCQVNRVKPQMPIMGQLPAERLEMHVVPFQYTGCDMFGPMYVRQGRSELKRYGCIFTCLSTRAIHLELCNDLTTDSFLLALRRFFARRTVPAKMISDCGSNFRGADKELRREAAKLNQEKIAEKMAQLQIEWQFNPPLAPHMGGCWERMVGLVKKVIKQTTELSKHLPSQEVLTTLLVEAENIVNSRPLLILSESGESLTPNHFLKHQKSTLTAGGKFEEADLILSKEWRKAQRLTEHFWQIWLKYYAPTLTNRPKWRKDGEPIKVGDRVVVVDPNLPRNIWPTGRIISTPESRDGKIRVVQVKMEEDGREYTRPVSRLAVLQPPIIMSEGKVD
uniref:Integrase catalytic domain-containing protein n=1 Tax=Phlebotomus papatasi TaxID=29031 RepID=A0A1B0DA28_PHLPP